MVGFNLTAPVSIVPMLYLDYSYKRISYFIKRRLKFYSIGENQEKNIWKGLETPESSGRA